MPLPHWALLVTPSLTRSFDPLTFLLVLQSSYLLFPSPHLKGKVEGARPLFFRVLAPSAGPPEGQTWS